DKAGVEIRVAGKEGGTPQTVQQCNDFLVEKARPPDIDADLSHDNPPSFKQFTLRLRDILIQDVHADFSSSRNSLACFINAWLANSTASLMASLVMLSFHSSIIVSHAIPLA